jgi:large subunit ribosomal protein L13e
MKKRVDFMVETARPIVKSPKGKLREGRGFSRSEIKKAGLDLQDTRKMGIPFDRRRKTCREENVNILKELLKKS